MLNLGNVLVGLAYCPKECDRCPYSSHSECKEELERDSQAVIEELDELIRTADGQEKQEDGDTDGKNKLPKLWCTTE